MSLLKDILSELFIENSALGILYNQKVYNDKSYHQLTTFEKVMTYGLISVIQMLVNLVTLLLPVLLIMATVRVFTFYPDNVEQFTKAFVELGIGEATWWKYLLVDVTATYLVIMIFIIIPFRLTCTIASFISYRKYL